MDSIPLGLQMAQEVQTVDEEGQKGMRVCEFIHPSVVKNGTNI